MKLFCKKKYSPITQFRSALFGFVLIAVIGFGFPAYGTVLAEVNQTSISSRTVDGLLQSYLSSIGHRELPISRMQSLRESILKRLIEEELLYQEGLKEGLVVTENEIDAGVALIEGRFQSKHSYESAMQKESLDQSAIRVGVERAILIKRTWSHLLELAQAERKIKLKAIHERADIQITASSVRQSIRELQGSHSHQTPR